MYSTACQNFGKRYGQDLKDCPYCGFAKAEIVNKVGILESINNSLVEKLSFLDYPQLYVTTIFHLVFILLPYFFCLILSAIVNFSEW